MQTACPAGIADSSSDDPVNADRDSPFAIGAAHLHENLYAGFRSLAQHVGLVALDIGARGGVSRDLLMLADSVDVYGFEPDSEECDRLNSQNRSEWKTVKYTPVALGERDETIDINLYRRRGCSSRLTARQKTAELYSRGDYYIHDGTMKVEARRLDDLATEHRIESPAFMKIDVQGMELEVFRGSLHTLTESLVGVRSEVGFYPLYDGQPLLAEIDQFLRPFGFAPMRWLELHEWRRTTKAKVPKLGPKPMPYSRGQLMHGDILYLLQPEDLPDVTESQLRRLVRLGLVAVVYDLLDHALAVFGRKGVRDYCYGLIEQDPVILLHQVSEAKSREYRGFNAFLLKVCNRLYGQ